MKSTKLIAPLTIALLASLSLQATAGTISGKLESKKKKYLPNTVIYLDSVKGDFAPPKEPALIDQRGMKFHPHVLPVLAGTKVEFLNSDEVAHNVFSPDESADKMNLGTWPKGEKRTFTFEGNCEKVCDAALLCNVHPEMEAFVVIMQNPYFALVDDSGFFSIKNIPAGEYTLKVWNPKRGAPDLIVTVTDSGSTEVTFALKKKKK